MESEDTKQERAMRVVGFVKESMRLAQQGIDNGYASESYLRALVRDIQRYIKGQGFDQ